MKQFLLIGGLVLFFSSCLGDLFNEDGDLYSDTDLLGTWDTTTTWFEPLGDRVDLNEMQFCMEGGKVTLCALISNPGTSSAMDLISDPASTLQTFDWSMSEAGLLSLHLAFENITDNGSTVATWTNDYFGWLSLTKDTMIGDAEHESFLNGVPDENYSGEFLAFLRR